MNPADVPDNLLEVLLHAADDVCVEMPPFEAARILCALLPAHERMVREQVAAELLAIDPVDWALLGQNAGRFAAETARGDAP